jgi:hypothetical protein
MNTIKSNDIQVNESTIRIISFSIVILSILGLLFKNVWLQVFIVIDFFTRGFAHSKFSLLNQLAIFIQTYFSINAKQIFAPPKKFASRIGLFISALALLSLFSALNRSFIFLTSILLVCAFLEAALSICIGCQVYNLFYATKNKFT